MMSEPGRTVRWALRLYPRSYRTEHGAEVARLVADMRKDIGRSGSRLAIARFWIATFVDILASSAGERMEILLTEHPVIGRAVLLATPVGALGATLAAGPQAGLLFLAIGVGAAILIRRSIPSALTGDRTSPAWAWPLAGLAMFAGGFAVLALPLASDTKWPLASTLGLTGTAVFVGSVVRLVIRGMYSRRPA